MLWQRGQLDASTRAWQRVLQLAPEHPAGLNFFGQLALERGQLAEARQLFERALRAVPPLPLAAANLARVLRAQGQPEAALKALDQALKLAPAAYAAHFEKASIYQQLGQPRNMALAYESGLNLLPADVAAAPALATIVAEARKAVADNKAQLGEFLQQRLGAARSGVDSRKLRRFDESLDISLGRKPAYLQRPSMYYFPELPSITFFEREQFPWVPAVEAATAGVLGELRAVLAADADGFEPYVQTTADEDAGQFAELDRNPDWSAYFLWKHGKRIEQHAQRCPLTMAMLAGVPQIEVDHRAPAAMFSALRPHTHIPAHNGATNCRLTVHLPLIIPPDCLFRVGNQRREWTPGELLIFDDTIEHEAWNNSDQLRVVFIFDIWNPGLSEVERELVRATQEGIMDYYGTNAPLGEF